MKKNSKPVILIIASALILVTVIILMAQGLKLKYEELQRENAQLESRIKTEKTISIAMKANYQMLTAEDVIKKYAAFELSLIDASSDTNNKIILSKDKIDELLEIAGITNE
jgi:hypothetical protein